MIDLKTALRAEAVRCADQMYEATMRLLQEQLSGLLQVPSVEAPRPRPSRESVEESLVNVVDVLKENPEGLRLEGLRQKTGLDNKLLGRAIYLGLESDQITKTGDRRTTTYFVAPTPSKAATEGRVVRRKKK